MDELVGRLDQFCRRPVLSKPVITDFDIDALPDDARSAACHVWTRRFVHETGSVRFAEALLVVASDLAAKSVRWPSLQIRAALIRLRDDEARHALLCRDMVLHLGGRIDDVPALAPFPEGPPDERLARLVLTGLAIAEAVSAARFAAVRAHTDLPVPRALVELFLADEHRHAELGFLLVSVFLEVLAERLDARAFDEIVKDELSHTLSHLERQIGMDARRRGLDLTSRPQPTPNPGVVEPIVDAAAFYHAIDDVVVPKLRVMLPRPALLDDVWSSRTGAVAHRGA